MLNQLYQNRWRLFFNYFIPSVKLISKKRVGGKTIKVWDKPKTPYQRVLDSIFINDKTKKELTMVYNKLNLFELEKHIKKSITNILNLIG